MSRPSFDDLIDAAMEVYLDGVRAAGRGEPARNCPYDGKPMELWLMGWREVERGREQGAPSV